jgi:ankyrin repeat protein
MPRKFTKDEIGKFVFGAQTGNAETVRLMLADGMPVDSLNEVKATALYTSCFFGRTEITTLLLVSGANPNRIMQAPPTARKEYRAVRTALEHAIARADTDAIDALLAHGANPTIVGHDRNTAAHNLLSASAKILALQGGEAYLNDKLSHMLEKGVDINQPGRSSETLLHVAIVKGAPVSTCKLLVARGAAIGCTNSIGEQPVHAAAKRGSTDIIELLIAAGADVNALNWSDETPLFHFETRAAGRILLEMGADIGWTDVRGRSALDLRVRKMDVDDAVSEATQVLVTAGCDPDQKDYAGSSARTTARERGLVAVEEFFAAVTARRCVSEAQPPESLSVRTARPAAPPIQDTAGKAFRAWFQVSKIAEPDGTPMRCYHGTNQDFTEFRIGSYFTCGPHYASDYAMQIAEESGEGDPRVVPVFISMQNPAIVDNAYMEWAGSLSSEHKKWRAKGYDGMISADMTEIVPFSPQQIKSAVGNSGAYDPASPDLCDCASRAPIAVDEAGQDAARRNRHSPR